MIARPALELVGRSGPAPGDSVLGVWEDVPSPVATWDGGDEGAPVWRVRLAEDRLSAGAQLRSFGWTLDATRRSFPQAEARLASLAPSPFAVTYAFPLSPEEELLSWLDPTGGVGGMVSFSPDAPLPPPSWWEERVADLTAFGLRVRTWCSPSAWIETLAGDGLLARSLVSFRGDLRTVWAPSHRTSDAALHHDAVRLAVASRAALVRAVALATEGALGLAVRLSNPATAVLAIPATWRFIQRVADEFRHTP